MTHELSGRLALSSPPGLLLSSVPIPLGSSSALFSADILTCCSGPCSVRFSGPLQTQRDGVRATRRGGQCSVPAPRAAEGSPVNPAGERRQEVAWHWAGKTSRRLLRKQYCIIVTVHNSPFFEPCWDNTPHKAERKKQSLPWGLTTYRGWRRRNMHGGEAVGRRGAGAHSRWR